MQDRLEMASAAALAALMLVTAACGSRGGGAPRIESLGGAPARLDDTQVRIATVNLWGVVALGLDWADHIDERFAALAARLGRSEPQLDIVLIQEAWKDSARRALLEDADVVRRFPHRVDVVAQPGGAGLVILSAFPIEEARFHRFRAQGLCVKFWEADCLGGKGVLAVRLAIGARSLWIGDTHTIACYPGRGEPETACDQHDPNGDYRWSQIVELRRHLEALAGDGPALVGGDFNFTRTSRYYPAMTRATIPPDPPEARAPAAPESARGWSEPGEEVVVRGRLDYIWTRPGTDIEWRAQGRALPIFSEPVSLSSGGAVALSDHPVLMTTQCLVRVGDASERCLALAAR